MDWNSSILWGVLSIISGFLISLFFYLIGNQQKKILIKGFLDPITDYDKFYISNLSNLYNNIEIKSLRKSTITIKNVGHSTIEKGDFSIYSPLLIKTKGIILSNYMHVQKMLCNSNTVKWTFMPLSEKDPNTLIIDFEFIPKKGEISFSILHTDYIDICGVLKEGRIIKNWTIKDIVITFLKIILKHVIIPLVIGCSVGLMIRKIIFCIF